MVDLDDLYQRDTSLPSTLDTAKAALCAFNDFAVDVHYTQAFEKEKVRLRAFIESLLPPTTSPISALLQRTAVSVRNSVNSQLSLPTIMPNQVNIHPQMHHFGYAPPGTVQWPPQIGYGAPTQYGASTQGYGAYGAPIPQQAYQQHQQQTQFQPPAYGYPQLNG